VYIHGSRYRKECGGGARSRLNSQVILLEATEVEEFDARGGGPRLVGPNRSIARAVVNGQRKVAFIQYEAVAGLGLGVRGSQILQGLSDRELKSKQKPYGDRKYWANASVGKKIGHDSTTTRNGIETAGGAGPGSG
jgi:hypothetical protein